MTWSMRTSFSAELACGEAGGESIDSLIAACWNLEEYMLGSELDWEADN